MGILPFACPIILQQSLGAYVFYVAVQRTVYYGLLTKLQVICNPLREACLDRQTYHNKPRRSGAGK